MPHLSSILDLFQDGPQTLRYKRVSRYQGQTLIRQLYTNNPLDGSFSQNIAGRWRRSRTPHTNGGHLIEMYSYTQPGG